MSPERNLSASVHRRLLNRARERGEDFNYLLTRYGNERLLYRLAQSPYREQFVLKGAALFDVWGDWSYRASRDIDLLGVGDASMEGMRAAFEAIAATVVEPDGLSFSSESVRVGPIREGRADGGVRVKLLARLGNARIQHQVDVGFGDAVAPAIEEGEYPTLLDFPPPRLRMYPRESVAAEKFEAMVRLGVATTRFKDFFDLWEMALTFDFDGESLAAALRATFDRRLTPLPDGAPAALGPEFIKDFRTSAQWAAFLRRIGRAAGIEFVSVAETLNHFLLPPAAAARAGTNFPLVWVAGEGWAYRPENSA